MLKSKTIKLVHERRILRGEGCACSAMNRVGRQEEKIHQAF